MTTGAVLYICGVIVTAAYMVVSFDIHKYEVERVFLDGILLKRRFYVACVLSCMLFPLFWILVAYYSLKEKCR